jgi:hypothetical protein
LSSFCFFLQWQQITKNKIVAVDDFAGPEWDGVLEDWAVEDEGMELAVFAAGIGLRRKIREERGVQFTACERAGEDSGVDTGSYGAELVSPEVARQLGAEIFQEDVAEGHFADTLGVEDSECLFHALFVERIAALRGDGDFVQRDVEGLDLLVEEFAADAVHGDAVVGFGDGGEKRDDFELRILAEGVEGHGGVFAAGPAEEDGFRHGRASGRKKRDLPQRHRDTEMEGERGGCDWEASRFRPWLRSDPPFAKGAKDGASRSFSHGRVVMKTALVAAVELVF